MNDHAPWIIKPERQCRNRDGSDKHVYVTFDAAMEECFTSSNRFKRLAPYRCEEHGWHVGSRAA